MSSDGALYSPESPVVTVRRAFVSTFVIVTVAPDTLAPLVSVTVPTRSGLLVWPSVGMAMTANRIVNAQMLANRRATFFVINIIEPLMQIKEYRRHSYPQRVKSVTSPSYRRCMAQGAMHYALALLTKLRPNRGLELPPDSLLPLRTKYLIHFCGAVNTFFSAFFKNQCSAGF